MLHKQSPGAGLILLCCLLSFSSKAQDYRPGYIIKNDNDSISGFIRYKAGRSNDLCDFKQSKRSGHTSFSPLELLAYGFADGRRYISLILPGAEAKKEKVFVRVLSEGPLTLYRYGKSFFVKKDELTELPVPEGKIIDPVEIGGNKMEKMDKRYVSILNLLIFDCQMKADDASYSEADVTRIVNNYNQCKGFRAESKKLKPLSRVNVGFLGGYVFSDLTVKESAIVPFSDKNTNFDISKTVIGGISLDLSSPRVYDKLFLTIEGWYFKSVYIGKDYRSSMLQDITIDVSSIRMFVGVRYNFLHESSTPFIKLGVSGTITQDLDLKSIVENENSIGQVFYDDALSGNYFEKKVRGYWFGAGYDQLVVGKMKAFVEFRLERADAYFGTPITPDSKLNSYSLLVGIRF
jgi:hypothetical protein